MTVKMEDWYSCRKAHREDFEDDEDPEEAERAGW